MKGVKDLGIAVAESRHAWRDFVELFAIEGRLASLRLVRLIIFALLGGLLIIIAWFLLCLAGADTLHQRYGWEWKYILLALAGFHLAAALLVVLASRNIGRRLFFPATLAHIRGREARDSVPHLKITDLERDRQIVEASLERAKVAAAQAARQSEQEFKAWITQPSVLASAAVIGFFLAPRRPKNGMRLASPPGFTGSLLPMILNQVMAAAIASVVSSLNEEKDIKMRVTPHR